MFDFLKKPAVKPAKKREFSRKVLLKNDISLLILDERWNSLFTNIEKTPEILKCEEKLRELLKEQSRLIGESKDISQRKKVYMDKILRLTTEAFDKDSEEARKDMQQCEKEIKQINDRLTQIEESLDNIPNLINEANSELLNYTVNVVYYKIRFSQRRVDELEKLIEETKEKLKEYIDEKGLLSQDYTDVYSYFHDLLGAEELEKLDKEFFG